MDGPADINDATCGGKVAVGAMHPLSEDLVDGCERFAALASRLREQRR
jgi:hypothetical protein